MSEEAAVVSGFVDFWTHLIQNNWSLVLGLLVAFILYRFAKASANLVLGLIFTAVAISMLTNMGILPPLDVLFERFKEVISLVRI